MAAIFRLKFEWRSFGGKHFKVPKVGKVVSMNEEAKAKVFPSASTMEAPILGKGDASKVVVPLCRLSIPLVRAVSVARLGDCLKFFQK